MFDRYPILITIGQKFRTKIEKKYNDLLEPFYHHYYEKVPTDKLAGLNLQPRKQRIIVSLTSYPARFKTLHLCIKSILNQTLKPDKIILYLDDFISYAQLTDELQDLHKHNLLSIQFRAGNLKPHMKYYYALQEYHNDIVITIDDDTIHRRNLLKKLFISYCRYPKAISSMRVHKLRKKAVNEIEAYNNWYFEYTKEKKPSFSLLATGFGGVLYPPNNFDKEIFNINNLKQLSYNADDIWLKFMQIKSGIPVVWVPSRHLIPIEIKNYKDTGLNLTNVHQNQNDIYIEKLSNFYHINLADYC